MKSNELRIGLFGGTFNPIHIGHVQLMRNASNIAELDTIYCIPTCVAPHKDNATLLSFVERCSMVRKKLEHEPHIFLSTIESELPVPSYTYRTLDYFKRSFPYSKQYFICGSIDFTAIHTWDKGRSIIQHTNCIIAPRGETMLDEIQGYIESYTQIIAINQKGRAIIFSTTYAEYIYMDIPTIPISSTEIRTQKFVQCYNDKYKQ